MYLENTVDKQGITGQFFSSGEMLQYPLQATHTIYTGDISDCTTRGKPSLLLLLLGGIWRTKISEIPIQKMIK